MTKSTTTKIEYKMIQFYLKTFKSYCTLFSYPSRVILNDGAIMLTEHSLKDIRFEEKQ